MKILIALIFALVSFNSWAEIHISETLLDTEQKPLAGILVRATPINGNTAGPVEIRTNAKGAFSLTLPDGEWFLEIDQRELLERGYFCVPGSCISPVCVPEVIFIDAVTLTPQISVDRSTTGAISVVAQFDWIAGIDPFLYRRYRIERSVDMVNWEAVSSILLADPPIRVIDPKAVEVSCTFYRFVREEDFRVRDFPVIVFGVL